VNALSSLICHAAADRARGDYESARGWSLGARRFVSRQMVSDSTPQQQAEFDRFDHVRVRVRVCVCVHVE
jgi:hypothetical protein